MEVSGPELFSKFADLSALNKFIKKSLAVQMKELEQDLSWHDLIGDADDWVTSGDKLVRTTRCESDGFLSTDSEDSDAAEFIDDDEPRAYDNAEDLEAFYDAEEKVAPKYSLLKPNFKKVKIIHHINLKCHSYSSKMY